MEKKSLVYTRIITSKYLPKFPENIVHIFTLLEQPSTDIDELVAAIEQEEELTNLILNNLNNNGNPPEKRITNVKDAILYWGRVSARNMIIFFITHAFYPKERAKETHLFTLFQYWTHVLATGVAAEEIAKIVDYEEPYQLFSYGLLHDIGILAIDACLADDEAKIIEQMKKGVPHLEAERLILDGLTHCDIGSWLCKREGFPEDISYTVQYHHTPKDATEYKYILKILFIANILGTNYIAGKMPVDVSVPMDYEILEELGLTENDLAIVVDKMPEIVSKYTPAPIGL